ncbi:RipA family octameric membrane protein [Nocardia asteroides]|uniref:RipA family octameric membrane protein n=1 Tax=Nocardia asteroides TaxID=1824 RepID=UPI001E464979|nr:hypothetical protein [Nocardia asteroides]UGT60148.1 hypothetical protein LTT61_23455 [Nocardia asteroides]
MNSPSSARLWTGIDSTHYESKAQYRAAILEQYKLYVEMADRMSQRRGLANTFFLTLNTALLAAAGATGTLMNAPLWQLSFALLGVLAQSAVWFYLLRSYRQLSAAKYQVIGWLEEQLPSSPYWRAEWDLLGAGKDRGLFLRLTDVEKWIPVIFAVAYAGVFVAIAVG